jgi:hypothetical protein
MIPGAINGKRIAALFLGAALAVTPLAASFAQEDAPAALPKTVKAKPVVRKRVSDDGESANHLSFGAISKSRIPSEPSSRVRTAEVRSGQENYSDDKVVHAIASDTSERGAIRRVGNTDGGDIAKAQWTASRTKSVLVNSPQDQDPAEAPSRPAPQAPKTAAQEPDEQPPPTGRKLRTNCGAEMEACEAARAKVFGNTINRIKIDLSPLLFSNEEYTSLDAMIEASERLTREGIKDSPFRTWTDRHGKIVAENARLFRLKANELILLDAAGAQKAIRFEDLSENDLCEIGDQWGIPVRCRLHEELYAGRDFTPTTFTWTASALCHKPLYFEQIELERYGHTPGPILEAPMAGVKFAADLATLPYKMGINPPNECRYALGYYRPGNCAPWIIPPVPLSLRGAIFQATAVTGVSWIIP